MVLGGTSYAVNFITIENIYNLVNRDGLAKSCKLVTIFQIHKEIACLLVHLKRIGRSTAEEIRQGV